MTRPVTEASAPMPTPAQSPVYVRDQAVDFLRSQIALRAGAYWPESHGRGQNVFAAYKVEVHLTGFCKERHPYQPRRFRERLVLQTDERFERFFQFQDAQLDRVLTRRYRDR